jgi:hypothetical protein
MKTQTTKVAAVLTAAITCLSIPAQASLTYGFDRITANNSANVESQLWVDVSDSGSSQVLFHFRNTGPIPSSITDIYFDSGAAGSLLASIAGITNSSGVNFAIGATPADLPGGTLAGFAVTPGLSADSQNPPVANGINPPAEWVDLLLHLALGKTFADAVTALDNGTLRIGLHVQAIIPDGFSDGFVNIPEPATVLLLGLGALATAGLSVRENL